MKGIVSHRVAGTIALLMMMGCGRSRSAQRSMGGARPVADVANSSLVDTGIDSACRDLRGVANEVEYAQNTIANETGQPVQRPPSMLVARVGLSGRSGVILDASRLGYGAEGFIPSAGEIDAFESGLGRYVASVPTQPLWASCLGRYARQYLGARFGNRRELIVHLLCDRPPGWDRSTIMRIEDNGCYFAVYYDVVSGRYESPDSFRQSQVPAADAAVHPG